MDRRGRSRDISPAAFARADARDRSIHAYISVNLVSESNLPKHHDAYATSYSPRPPSPHTRHPHHNTMTNLHQPVASTSRLTPSPSPSRTSSTMDSEPAEPLTPPEYVDAALIPPSRPPDHSVPFDYYESPPSPPHSLLDQMQLAYALDNMHLAKVLLLKLQGVEINGDDDPRIAAVADEDFSSFFVPAGGLELDEEVKQLCREGERRDRERKKIREREARLKACQELWELSTRTMREEKAAIARRKEDKARCRRRQEIEAREREKEREARERELELQKQMRPLRVGGFNQRPLLSYDNWPRDRSPQPSITRPADTELYHYPVRSFTSSRSSSSSCSISPPDPHTLSLPRARRELALQHSQSIGRSIPFTDVIASMSGPLFPDKPASAESYSKRSPVQVELLESLFTMGECRESEIKGKDRENVSARNAAAQRQDADRAPADRVCSSTSTTLSRSTTSSSVATITRSNSWLSFCSRSSVSTAVTTPSSSPLSPRKIASQLPALSIPSPLAVASRKRPLSRSPLSPSYTLISVRDSDHPLAHTLAKGAEPLTARGRPLTRGGSAQRTPSTASQTSVRDAEGGLVRRMSQSVSNFLDLAAQFQRAYVQATFFSVGVDAFSSSRSDSRSSSCSRSPSRARVRDSRAVQIISPREGLKPEGYRAPSSDVLIFLCTLPPQAESDDALLPTRTLIPLVPAISPPRALTPHSLVFQPPTAPPRSPWKPQNATVHGPRLRPVANPILLRLQALQNVCADHAVVWEGRAREGRMSAGKEKMVGVAWEGIGRSSLGWEVSAFS